MSRYSLILADPPWKYGSRCTHKKTSFGGGAGGHYDLMSTADIAALPVGRDYAAKDCALALWVTGPHFDSGIQVCEAWGFRFVTVLFTWIKTNKNAGTPFAGPGYYTRANAEFVILGMRGQVKPANQDVSSVILEPHPRDEATGKIIHSRKPACTYQRLERLFGDVPRLELFAREAQRGWEAIGNQLGADAVTLEPQRTLFDWQGRNLMAVKGGAV